MHILFLYTDKKTIYLGTEIKRYGWLNRDTDIQGVYRKGSRDNAYVVLDSVNMAFIN